MLHAGVVPTASGFPDRLRFTPLAVADRVLDAARPFPPGAARFAVAPPPRPRPLGPLSRPGPRAPGRLFISAGNFPGPVVRSPETRCPGIRRSPTGRRRPREPRPSSRAPCRHRVAPGTGAHVVRSGAAAGPAPLPPVADGRWAQRHEFRPGGWPGVPLAGDQQEQPLLFQGAAARGAVRGMRAHGGLPQGNHEVSARLRGQPRGRPERTPSRPSRCISHYAGILCLFLIKSNEWQP